MDATQPITANHNQLMAKQMLHNQTADDWMDAIQPNVSNTQKSKTCWIKAASLLIL
jgi:hypothetical protein